MGGVALVPAIGAYLIAAATIFLLGAKWKLPARDAILLAALPPLVLVPAFWTLDGGAGRPARVGLFIAQVALGCGLSLLVALTRFYRDPERVPPERDGVILSPADGEVIYIRAVDDCSVPMVSKRGREFRVTELASGWPTDVPSYVIAVEMNLLNVHVNRCPVGGRVTLVHHVAGSFVSLRRDEAPFINERATTVIDTGRLSVAVVQVASRLVRRITTYLAIGQTVGAGQRLGMIKFGSLVAVVVPQTANLRITTAVGERVTAGESILARYDGDVTRG